MKLDSRSSDPIDIETVLKLDVEIATQEHLIAMAEFWRICAEVDSAGSQEIEAAARRQKVASEWLEWALKRFEDYIHNGRVPEDL